LSLKFAFITATVITIMTDFEFDIESLFESLSAPDFEFGEEYDSEPNSEVEDALLVFFKPRDSIFFSFS